jgi:hypothetical protein
MKTENSAVIENPVMSEGVAQMVAQEAAAPQPPVTDINTAQLPGIPTVTDAEKLALMLKQQQEAAAVRETAIARFDVVTGGAFKLEGQIIGQAIKRKTSAKGGVRLGLLPAKEMSVLSGGMKGEDLKHFTRMRADELKVEQNKVAMAVAGDRGWTGAGLTLSAKGDKITLEYKKATPVTTSVKAEPTDEELSKLLGIPVDAVKAMKAMAKAANNPAAPATQEPVATPPVNIATPPTPPDEAELMEQLKREEQEAIERSAGTNGAVHAPESE